MLSKFIEDCNRLLPAGSGRFCEMHDWALLTQHVSLNNVCTWTVCKWFRRNSGHLTVQIWTHADIMSRKRCTKHIWKLYSKPNTVSELKVALDKTWEFFPQNKAVARFKKGWENTWSLVEDILSICCNSKKCSHLRCLRLSWTPLVRDIDIVKTSICYDLKQRSFVSSVHVHNSINISRFATDWVTSV